MNVKNHNVHKRLLSFILTIALLLGMIWVNPGEAMAASKISLKSGKIAPGKIYVGKTYDLKVVGKNNVKFVSSNRSVATIGATTGKLKAVAPGEVKITAMDKKSKKTLASKKFTVLQRAKSVTCDSSVTLHVGESTTLIVKKDPANSTDVVSFATSDMEVATVDTSSGKITAQKAGTATISVYSKANKDTPNSNKGNVSTTCEVIVIDDNDPPTINVDEACFASIKDITYDPAIPAGRQQTDFEISTDVGRITVRPSYYDGKGTLSFNWYEADGKVVNKGTDTLVSDSSQVFKPDLSQPGIRYYYCSIEYRVSPDLNVSFVTPVASVTVPGNLKVTFDPNGGSFKNTSAATKEVGLNKPIGALPSEGDLTPPEGKKFCGWATTAGSQESNVTSSTAVSRNTTLYAVWLASDKLTVWADRNAISKGESTQIHANSHLFNLSQELTGISNSLIKPSYASSDTTIVTVDEYGIATGHKPGTATITVTYSSLSLTGTQDITVLIPKVNSVTLDPEIDHIYLNNGSTQVKAAIDPSTACDKITYSSSNRDIATVTEDGIITGVKEGTFNLIVLGAGQEVASYPIKVLKLVPQALYFKEASGTIEIGETFQIKPYITPTELEGKGKFVYKMESDKDMATIDENGLVTGLKNGTALFTVSFVYEGKEYLKTSYRVVVQDLSVQNLFATFDRSLAANSKLSLINFDKLDKTNNTVSIKVDESAQIYTVAAPDYSHDITPAYVSANPSIATVDSSGRVTGVTPGNTTVTVSADGKSAAVSVTVRGRADSLTATVDGTYTDKALRIGDTTQIAVTVTPSDAPLEFTSSNQSVATVDSNGLVTGIALGDAVITVKADDLTATIDIKVIANPQTPTITSDLPSSATFGASGYINGSFINKITIDATVTDNGTLSYEWHGADNLTDDGVVVSGSTLDKELTSANRDLFDNYQYIFVRIINTVARGISTYIDSTRMHITRTYIP